MPKWFRYKRVGFGFTPNSIMGWVLTAALIAVVVSLANYFHQGYARLPLIFYVYAGAAIAVYTVIALLTVDRDK
jgi:hypothetical protein